MTKDEGGRYAVATPMTRVLLHVYEANDMMLDSIHTYIYHCLRLYSSKLVVPIRPTLLPSTW